MQRHRIFIAINLPENTRKKLSECQSKWPSLPCYWTKKDNIHITLLFLGYLTDEELLEVIKDTEKIVSECESFRISLNKIIYGPPKKFPPRMVWATGEQSEELKILQKKLEEGIYYEPLPDNEKREKRNYFVPHITLGRIKSWELNQMDREEIPEINEETNLNFLVESIEIMESELKRGGPEYTVLESYQLKN